VSTEVSLLSLECLLKCLLTCLKCLLKCLLLCLWSVYSTVYFKTQVSPEVSTLSLKCLLKCLLKSLKCLIKCLLNCLLKCLKCLLRCDPYPIGKWHSSESDVNSMVMSTSEQSSGKALMVDMGAFHLAEFAQTLCLPFVGSAVHGGVHVVQVVSQLLAMRMLMIPALDDTFKVCHSRRDN